MTFKALLGSKSGSALKRNMRRVAIAGLVASSLSAASASAQIYASSLVDSNNVTSFGSGLVTGAPDGGGLWLGSSSDPPAMQGDFTVFFATALGNGAGADLLIHELVSSANETFNVSVSSDNIVYVLLGEYSATNNLVDFGAFMDPVSYVMLANTSTTVSADIDALEGFYVAAAVPEPATWTMMLLGFGAVGFSMRRARRVKALPELA